MSELDRLLDSDSDSDNHEQAVVEMSEVSYGVRLLQELISEGVIGSWSRVDDTEKVRDEIRLKHDEALRMKFR